MEINNTKIESFLKSFAFSFLLFLYLGFSAVKLTLSLIDDFDFIELLRLFYSVAASLFFLIRVKPSVVSMNPVHWIVALITSFSTLFFVRASSDVLFLQTASYVLVILAHLVGLPAILTLGRSFGLFPALRKVKTKYIYQVVRHPMYLASILFKLGYVLKNPSVYNVLLFAVIVILYDRRAKYEEGIMSHDNLYVDYLQQVKYRFIPGIY